MIALHIPSPKQSFAPKFTGITQMTRCSEVPHLPLSDLLKAGSVMRSDQAAQALSSHLYPIIQVNITVYFSLPDYLHSFCFLVSEHILYLSETFFPLFSIIQTL